MSAYIDRPGGYDLALPGPYHQHDVTMRIFALRADYAALKKTCDRYLNLSGDGKTYLPLAPIVMIAFCDMKRVTCGDPALGWMHEIDVSCFVPTLRFELALGDPVGVAMFNPYLFVNNAWAMATGREGHGFRKDLGVAFSAGDPEAPGWPGAQALDRVDACVIASPGDRLATRRILELHPPGAPPASAPPPWPPQDFDRAFLDVLRRVLAEADQAIRQLVEDFFPQVLFSTLKLRAVFLKQYRDARDFKRACHQEVIEADGIVTKFSGGRWLPGDWKLTVNDYASHPVAQELGLAAGRPQGVLFALEIGCDFDVAEARP